MIKGGHNGISEVRWTGAGSFELGDGGRLIYSGGNAHMHGVGVMVSKSAAH